MKDVPGYEGLYAVTEDGRVWSHPRAIQRRKKFDYRGRRDGLWLAPAVSNTNRFIVSLCKDNTTKTWLVHRLVAMTFLPNDAALPMVNHIDGNPHNNAVTNLEWCDAKFNQQHAKRLGLRASKVGTKNGRSKVTERAVLRIRDLNRRGVPREAVARKFGLSMTQTARIIRKQCWSHV